jgi:putative endonuclease
MANKRNGTIYAGVTNDLTRRVDEHRRDALPGFTRHYQTHMLVYFGETSDVDSALNHEKRVKKWPRTRKLELIQTTNPEWKDLWDEISK